MKILKKKTEKLTNRKGITLIALVITIIVLLILAGVTIAALSGPNGILSNANKAKEQTAESGAREKINIAVIGSYDKTGRFDSEKFKEEIQNMGGSILAEDDSTITVEMDGYEAKIDKEGNIIGEIEKAGPRPEVISAKVVNEAGEGVEKGSQAEGTKLYIEIETKIEGGEIERIKLGEEEGEKAGEKYRIEINKNGKYTVEIIGRVEGEEYSTKYTITVEQYENSLKIGDYVRYNVTYTDVYTGYEFTAENGWRVLNPGTDNGDGTYTGLKLISTGIPAKLYYYYPNIKNKENNGDYGNWAGNAEQRERYANEYYSSSSNDNYNMYAASGLRYNFEKIKFTQGTTSSKNEGYYTKVNGKTSGNLSETEFLTGGAEEVHNLTLAELNEARGESNLKDSSSVSTNTGATGLFHLKGLNKYNYNLSSTSNYWLASPHPNSTDYLRFVYFTGNIGSNSSSAFGVRPVVSLPSSFQVEETEG